MNETGTLREYCTMNGKSYASGRRVVSKIAEAGAAELVADGMPGRGVWRVALSFPWPSEPAGWKKGRRRGPRRQKTPLIS
jgi:hypothetical protein